MQKFFVSLAQFFQGADRALDFFELFVKKIVFALFGNQRINQIGVGDFELGNCVFQRNDFFLKFRSDYEIHSFLGKVFLQFLEKQSSNA